MVNQRFELVVRLSHFALNEEKFIILDAPENEFLKEKIKTILGMKWSKNNNCWYILNNQQNINNIFFGLKGIAWIDSEEFFNKTYKGYSDSRKVVKNSLSIKKTLTFYSEQLVLKKIQCPDEFIEKLKIKRYSENTIRTYKYMFEDFLNFFPDKNIDELSENEIIQYQLHLVRIKNVSVSYQNQSINAIKFYYEKVKLK